MSLVMRCVLLIPDLRTACSLSFLAFHAQPLPRHTHTFSKSTVRTTSLTVHSPYVFTSPPCPPFQLTSDEPLSQWGQCLFAFNPITMNHILQHATAYEKPTPSRRLISSCISLGTLSPAWCATRSATSRRVFPAQAMRAIVLLTFEEVEQQREKLSREIKEPNGGEGGGHVVNMTKWAGKSGDVRCYGLCWCVILKSPIERDCDPDANAGCRI